MLARVYFAVNKTETCSKTNLLLLLVQWRQIQERTKNMNPSSKQFSSVVLVTILAFITPLHATSLTWDADPTTANPQDGAGSWDTTTNTW